MLTLAHCKQISGSSAFRPGSRAEANAASIIAGLRIRGAASGLDRPHRLAHYIAQLAHESGRFVYDREVWGPTKAQRGYEGRDDLGNTEPGDGVRFKGRTGGQITGRFNYRGFTSWARSFDPTAPDFERDPEAINSDPWEGLGPVWYFETHNLGRFADRNDPEGLTKRWNGGFNGYPDRLDLYTRTALVFLGYGPDDVARFQGAAGLTIDGDAGILTRGALHDRLVALSVGPAPAPVVTALPAPERLARLADLHRQMGEILAQA